MAGISSSEVLPPLATTREHCLFIISPFVHAHAVQYLGFNTKQCVTHNTVTLKPLSKPADAVWARWVLAILEERPDGSYIVQIANYWDPQNTGSGPK